jgi:hypothetical protein
VQLPYLHCHCEPDEGGRGNLPVQAEPNFNI